MSKERGYEGPSNIVGRNKYISDSQRRVSIGSIHEQEWYIARLINPEEESIGKYAIDRLMRVLKVSKLKNGDIRVHATSVTNDGSEEPNEDNAATMNADSFVVDDGSEAGYLLDVFARSPKKIGSLAAEAALTS